MESCSNKRVLNKSKCILYIIATLFLDDSFAHSWHCLNQLNDLVTWNAIQITGIYFLLNVFEAALSVVIRLEWYTE